MEKKDNFNKKILRIIDANVNRVKEGLRVCEDEVRFFSNNSYSTKEFKTIRHRVTDLIKQAPFTTNALLKSRDVKKDVGRPSNAIEFNRKNTSDIFLANIQRSKESIRVIEEFFKVIDKNIAEKFKDLRYRIYSLEQKTMRNRLKK